MGVENLISQRLAGSAFGQAMAAMGTPIAGPRPSAGVTTPTPTATVDLTPYAVEGATRPDSFSGMRSEFSSSLSKMIAAAPPEIRAQLKIGSGYRSPARQRELYAAAVKKYGSPEAARKWVAPEGKSQHNHGNAADLKYGSDAAREWVHGDADAFGLAFPLGNEPWHIEMKGARGHEAPPDGINVNIQNGMPFRGDPLDAYSRAVRSIESAGSGGYKAVGRRHPTMGRALGAYQVMEANLPEWSKAAVGREVGVDEFLAHPEIQDAVFKYKFGESLNQYGNASDAASVWFTGRPRSKGANARDSLGTSGSDYVSKFEAALAADGGTPGGGTFPDLTDGPKSEKEAAAASGGGGGGSIKVSAGETSGGPLTDDSGPLIEQGMAMNEAQKAKQKEKRMARRQRAALTFEDYPSSVNSRIFGG